MFYSETPEKLGGNFDPSRYDATKQFLQHYDNLTVIDFMVKSTDNRSERTSLETQGEIARRKMRYWERQPNFSKEAMLEGIASIKSKWRK